MATKISRNELCPCGSELKYKKCCGLAEEGVEAEAPFLRLVVWAVGAAALIGLVLVVQSFVAAPPEGGGEGKIWSPEHGHWHNAAGGEIGATASAAPSAAPSEAPGAGGDASAAGAEGAGRVWSEEHGHWHGPDGKAIGGAGGTTGRVWSEEHGHWHNASAAEHSLTPRKVNATALEERLQLELERAKSAAAE